LRAFDLVLVERSFADLRDEDLPHPASGVLAHGVPPPVPEVEVPHDRDAPGIRRPDGEVHPSYAFEGHRVCPELVVEPEVVALAEEVEVLLAEDLGETVGVLDLGLATIVPCNA
jgi:hypothetical protein